MYKAKYSLEQLKFKIKEMEAVIGPRVNYNSDWFMADSIVDVWVLEYLFLLKERYYNRQKRNKKKHMKV